MSPLMTPCNACCACSRGHPPPSSQPPRTSHNMRIAGSRVHSRLRNMFYILSRPRAQSVVNGSAGCAAADDSAGRALFDLPQCKHQSTTEQQARRPSPSGHQRVDTTSHHHRLQLLYGALEIVSPEGAAVVLPQLVECPQKTPGSAAREQHQSQSRCARSPRPTCAAR